MQQGSVFFMHIPKCGGLSVQHFIASSVPSNEIAPFDLVDFLRDARFADLNKYRYFFAHVPSYLRQVLPKPTFSFSWLRDPINRAVSVYNHTSRAHTAPYYERFMRETSDFESFISHPYFRLGFVDQMTNFFGAELHLAAFDDRLFMNVASNGVAATPPDRHTFARAKERMLEFDFIGFCEEMARDCQLLAGLLGFNRVAAIPHVNADPGNSKRRPSVQRNSDIEALVATHCPFDTELYDFARQRFQR